MTKINALRKFFLPCIHNTNPSPPPLRATTRKRLSISLREGLDETTTNQETPLNPNQDSCTSSSSTSPTSHLPTPPRPSRTMVIGTVFGQRKGRHIWFCVQHNRLATKPIIFLELSIPTSTLIQEMGKGLVRIALEFNSIGSELNKCPLHSVPLWTLFCNGKKLGFAVRRKITQQNRAVLKTMANMTFGAGAIPNGSGFGSGSEEIIYMRANYEYVVGSADSESFHMINPEAEQTQELSVFLLRSR